jgi:hypothetical protein
MCINNAVLGARPGHPYIKALLDRIPRRLEGPEAFEIMGPSMATAVAMDFGLKEYVAAGVTLTDDTTILPKEAFYPYFYGEQRPPAIGAETYAVHLWAKRW